MNLALLFGIGAPMLLAVSAICLVMLREIQRRERLDNRILMIHGKPPVQGMKGEPEAFRVAVIRGIAGVGQVILRTGMVSARTLTDVENTLAFSGFRGPQGVGIFIGCKILLTSGLPLLAWLTVNHLQITGMLHTLAAPAAGVVGLMLPDWAVGKWRKRYLARLEAGLPDALDMMVICTQAGLALGPSIIRVAAELQHAYREIAAEFEMTANELQIMADSRIALGNLGMRTGVESFKRLSTTLIQTVQYGTPVSEALRVLSAEMRQDTLTAFEGRAARLPVLLTMPMIAFILPCLFLIVGGPAMIQVMRSLSH